MMLSYLLLIALQLLPCWSSPLLHGPELSDQEPYPGQRRQQLGSPVTLIGRDVSLDVSSYPTIVSSLALRDHTLGTHTP